MEPKKWWNEINDKYKNDNWSGGLEIISESKRKLTELNTIDLNKSVEYLTNIAIKKDNGYWLALEILIEFCNENSILKIHQSAQNLKDNYNQDEDYYICLLRIIASNTNDDKLELVKEYIFKENFNTKQSLLHWSLWPKNKKMFCIAYTNYLENQIKWTQTGITSSFMTAPDALEELKKHLITQKKTEIWKVLRDDLKKEIQKDLWEKSNRKLISVIL